MLECLQTKCGQTKPKISPEQSAIFQLVREINKTNAKNVTSIVKTTPPPGSHFHDDWAKNVTSRVHVIQLTGTIFEVNSHIKKTNVLTKFNENWVKNVTSRVFTCFYYIHIEKNAPPTGGHISIKTSVLTNFHDDWKTAPPTGGHTNILTNFELNRDFIWKKLLTKFHEDRTKNVVSRVFTNKCERTDGQTMDKDRSHKLT
ncbi:hypothetical protein DPMN_002682 [Dreissena polymorpha]|uniref:Uncharacterized protein n=1 Tax=Dreissena polymorpha TaxID=45954 RepID=A0A9D4MLU2_DREPO|nr:hypothetical protein DPMN_002682 [Dreissena polymorpha]